MVQSSGEVTYTFHNIFVECCVFFPYSLDVLSGVFDYFLLIIGVGSSELGDETFQEAHVIVSQLKFLARVRLLF